MKRDPTICVAAIDARHQRIGPDFNLGGYVRISSGWTARVLLIQIRLITVDAPGNVTVPRNVALWPSRLAFRKE